jgi:hypothetical protein
MKPSLIILGASLLLASHVAAQPQGPLCEAFTDNYTAISFLNSLTAAAYRAGACQLSPNLTWFAVENEYCDSGWYENAEFIESVSLPFTIGSICDGPGVPVDGPIDVICNYDPSIESAIQAAPSGGSNCDDVFLGEVFQSNCGLPGKPACPQSSN